MTFQTGTLTEDGLDMMGIVPVIDGSLPDAERNVQSMNNHPLFEGMLVCHSLTLIDNELCGDPLDIKVFPSLIKSLFKDKLQIFIKSNPIDFINEKKRVFI